MTRVFVLTNHKGGVGKSTSATNCSDPQKLDTKVPALILTRVLAGAPTSLPRIQPG